MTPPTDEARATDIEVDDGIGLLAWAERERPDGSSFILTRHFSGGWSALYEGGPPPVNHYGRGGPVVIRRGKGDTAIQAIEQLLGLDR